MADVPGVIDSPGDFGQAVLARMGMPQTPQNVQAMVGWAKAEGGHWANNSHYNPLNTTQPMPGATNTGTQGNIKSYRNWNDGVNATVQTLRNGHYAPILAALRAGNNAGAVATAIGQTPWGTSGSLTAQTIAAARGAQVDRGFGSGPVSWGGPTRGQLSSPGTRASSTTISTPASTNYVDAGIAAFMRAASAPINTSGKVTVSNPLALLEGNIASGAYTTPGSSRTVTTPGTQATSRAAGMDRIHVTPGHGDVAPLAAGWTIGRTDMGVDANAKAGTPIRAMNDSQLVHVYPNWYNGQPYALYRLTAGPNAGKYYYVAEQINNIPKVGTTVPRGQAIATYAPSGTGIEIGWGTPTWQTQAQASGNTGDSAHGNAPAGLAFAHYLAQLRSGGR